MSQALSLSNTTEARVETLSAKVIPLRPVRRLGQYEAAEAGWVEDFDDLTVDELRELPNRMQLGLDLSIFD